MLDEVLEPLAPELLWILLVGFGIAFLLAFSVGANDVSNSFGTSVGSKVLTVTQACLLATFFEVAGASLLGYSVCDTFRKKMYKVDLYQNQQKELMLGALACLIGSAGWNIIATTLKMPISGTHSIVGATIGFNLVLRGPESIQWWDMLRIVASWFASPLLAGAISSIIYIIISKTVIRKVNPLKYGLKALPLFYGATIFINVASVLISGPEVMGLDKIPWYAGLFISLAIAGATIAIVALFYVPKLKRRITDELVMSTMDCNKKKGGPRGNSAIRETKLSESAAKPDTSGGGFDNGAFVKGTGEPPEKPKRAEITLSPRELMKSTGGGAPAAARPPVAAKPAHLLKRQAAEPGGQQLEEIDLGTDQHSSVAVIGEGSGGFARKADIESSGSGLPPGDNSLDRPGMISGERLEVFRLFSALQILTACFASFAHGTNDVSNAVAPLIPIWNIYATGSEDVNKQTQVWILLFGGIGICTGLWAWGRAVMSTVGEGLTKLTPSKGFSIELGAAISVLTATKLGLPISTTHCKVGSVVIVGLVGSKFCSQDNLMNMTDEERLKADEAGEQEKVVDWKLFGNIAITWIVTVPLAAAASALIMLLLKWIVL